MDITPDFAEFERGWAEGRNQLLTIRLAADLDTPVSLMLKLAEAAPNSFMLESVTGGEISRALFLYRHEARSDLGMP